MTFLALVLVFACACLNDALSCAWHRAREGRAYARGVALAGLLELVQWLPVLLALEYRASIPSVVIASVLGAQVGSVVGFRAR